MALGPGEPPLLKKSSPIDKLKGFFFCVSMLVIAFFSFMYILMPLLPLVFIHPRLYRRIIDRLFGFWLIIPSALMEYLFFARFTVTGDAIDHSRPALIIMNHRTCLDWLFFWNALFRINPWLLMSEKISLKALLRYLPGAGWAMSSDVYMFLERSFNRDRSKIMSLIKYYARVGDNYQLLLFPEGTDKCHLATARSHTFANKKGLAVYDYVLHPRVTGFVHILQKMRQENYIDSVYDVTVAYNDAIIQTEIDFLRLGTTPRDIRFDIRRIPIADLPVDDAELGKWLKNLWAAKEERLRKFFTQPSATRQLDTKPDAQKFEMSLLSSCVRLFCVTIFFTLAFYWIYFFYACSNCIYLLLGTVGYNVAVQAAFGGGEWVIIGQGLRAWNRAVGGQGETKHATGASTEQCVAALVEVDSSGEH